MPARLGASSGPRDRVLEVLNCRRQRPYRTKNLLVEVRWGWTSFFALSSEGYVTLARLSLHLSRHLSP